jgi:LytS/YehU family sensor histidine kinase
MDIHEPPFGAGQGHPPIPAPAFHPRPMFPHGDFRHLMSEYSRVRLLLFALVYIFSTSIGILNLMDRYRQKQQQAEHEKSKAQLQLLTSQVNPHFLFNTLNAIYYLTAGKSDKAPDAVLQLADIMRYTLTESQSEHVPLQREMDFLRKYIDLQLLRLTDKTTVDAALPQQTEGLEIAPLLLIPYIENCFKYGVSAHVHSSISIKISVTGQRELRAVLSNRVFGHSQDSMGFGMQTAAKRLEALYPGKHKIDIQNSGEHFTVLLMIKL